MHTCTQSGIHAVTETHTWSNATHSYTTCIESLFLFCFFLALHSQGQERMEKNYDKFGSGLYDSQLCLSSYLLVLLKNTLASEILNRKNLQFAYNLALIFIDLAIGIGC